MGSLVDIPVTSDVDRGRYALTGWQKAVLFAACAAAYVVCRVVFGLLGLPAVSGRSALLLNGPFYGVVVAIIAFVALAMLARPVVRDIRPDAPLLVAAVGLVALPVHGGDVRGALLASDGAGVYLSMVVELVLLAIAVAVAYGVVFRTAVAGAPLAEPLPDASPPTPDTAGDRLAAVGVQALVVLALLGLIGQSPLKGQAIFGVALAGFLAAWLSFKARRVIGSQWAVAGTLLAGVVAYGWSFFNPDGLAIGDIRHGLAGAAYVLPLHYATAGVTGTVYGHWAVRSGEAAD